MNFESNKLKKIIWDFILSSYRRNKDVALIYSEKDIWHELSFIDFIDETVKIINFLKANLTNEKLLVLNSSKNKYTYSLFMASLIIGIPFTVIDDKDENSAKRLKKAVSNLKNYLFIKEESILNFNYLKTSKEKNFDFLNRVFNEENISDDAYIMYTSGSTGEPKGVCIKRESFALYLNWIKEKYKNLVKPHFHLSLSPVHFDNSIHDLAIFIASNSLIMMNDVYEFKNLFFKYYDQLSINSIYGTPSLIKKLKLLGLIKEIANKKSLKFIGFGGEGYSWDELQNLSNEINQKVDFHNYYGPTEGTCMCSCYTFDSCETKNLIGVHSKYSSCPPLGKFFPYFRFEIIDNELVISGQGMMKGYVLPPTDDESSYDIKIKDNKYRTGDICSLLEGEIYIHGRIDNQIKINGIRIEIEEVEFQINSLLHETKSCLFLVEDRFPFLAAVIEINLFLKNYIGDQNNIIKLLRKDLPNSMLPADLILVDEIPTNRSGKIDRKSCKNLYQKIRFNND